MSTRCTHPTTTDGEAFGYTGSVAVHPYTDEHRAAHGCSTYTETCDACGAERAVNANQGFREYSPWGPSLAERAAHEERLRQARWAQAVAAQEEL